MHAPIAQERREMLRFLVCGSVDDGKSTLIGRLLHDCDLIPDDQLAALERDSKTMGTVPGDIDFALLVDGLQAEREQGITIDVAYRYMTTAKRKFIVADTPGHEQYTRNMVTGASHADIAVMVIDARKGILPQTRRHTQILALMGIAHVMLAVNKMDLVGYAQELFVEIETAYRALAKRLGIETVTCIPVAAVAGDNLVRRSDKTAWYLGPSVLEFLESVPVPEPRSQGAFRMPVQWVNRPNLDFRGFSGRIVAGTVVPGQDIAALPSGRRSRVARIVTLDGDRNLSGTGESITLTLEDEIDISRGDLFACEPLPEVADQFVANLVWLNDAPMLPGRRYLIRIGSQTAAVSVTALKHRIDIDTMAEVAANELVLNDIGTCAFAAEAQLVFEPYRTGGPMGTFILIDRLTQETVGAGLVLHSLRRATNIQLQALDVHRDARAKLKGHSACTLWFTGLSGAGKSTIANAVERELAARACHTFLVDGDNIRHGLNRDLGFTDADRVENIRRVAEVARLMTDAGLIVLTAVISPFQCERETAREIMAKGEFIEIFVDTPLDVCERRDPKGLYAKARRGEIPNFTGIGSAYEAPENPDIRLTGGDDAKVEELADRVIAELERRAIIR
jgi:bifunctional enzyme CysN/CysC